MRSRRRLARLSPLALAASFALAMFAACSGPFATFPGGAIDGPVEPAPARFADTDNGAIIELETRVDDPYSVNVAACIVDGRLYVSAGDNHSSWAQNMDADARVRVKLRGRVYELAATRVTDPAEFETFAIEWSKNAWARDPRELDEVFAYRLEPR